MDLWGLETGDKQTNSNLNVRNVYETISNFLRIEETVSNTDINFSLNILKYDTVRGNGNKETKIDVSMYVENSVSQESRENYGVFSKSALASELNVLIKFDKTTIVKNNLANADEGNSFTVYIPRTNNPSLLIDLSVIAINQNNITETFNYEVNFK